MANTSSAKKAIRVAKRKRQINLKLITKFKKARKKVLDLIKAGKLKEAEKAMSQAYKALDKAAKRNTIHPNKSARLKSRLVLALNKAKNKTDK